MKTLFDKFQKLGGINLLKEYWKAGVLGLAVFELIRHGFSQKSLEISRLRIQHRVNKKLKNRYFKKLEYVDQVVFNTHEKSNKTVWICWLQGMEQAPDLVKHCFASVQQNLQDYQIIVITSENYAEYTAFPDYVIKKWQQGIITNTHFSDLLRLELLFRHGGLWLDATVWCTNPKIPDYITDSELFLYQELKPGKDGHVLNISSWLMQAKAGHKIIYAVRHLLYEYWKTENGLVDYFLIHHFFALVIEKYPDLWNKVYPACNSTPHIVLLSLINNNYIVEYKNVSCFHKLAYKHEIDIQMLF